MPTTYILLSPTFGMHQYTADLANRARQWAGGGGQGSGVRGQEADNLADSQTVRLITTATLPRDRYSPAVALSTPVTTHGTGFSREGLDFAAYRRVLAALSPGASSAQSGPITPEHRPFDIQHSTFDIPHSTFDIQHSTFDIPPSTFNIQHSTFNIQHSVCHFTGVHAWNLPLIHALRRRGVPVIHTLHDLDPHTGVRFGALIRLWNRLIIATGCHLLVHGWRYRDQLLAAGVPAERITYTPLLHGFLSAAQPWPPVVQASGDRGQASADQGSTYLPATEPSSIVHRPSSIPHSTFDIPHSTFTVLFFGRVEAYKGADTLLNAWQQVKGLAGETLSIKGEGTQATGEMGAATEIREAGEAEGIREHLWQPRLIIAGPVAREVTLGALPPAVELRDRRILDAEGDALFRAADLLVLPYRDATQSALVAAAYAYGVPVIVTAVGALPEYVVAGETGWIVPPDDPAALAAALRAALADPARLARLGAAGRAWFAAQRRAETATLAEMYGKVARDSSLPADRSE